MSNDLVVVDISHWQPDPIDWAKLKGAGIAGVIHKATEGQSYVDDKLFKRASAALAHGLKWSTYHFMRPGSMQAQMDHYLGTIDPVQGERVCLDHEDKSVSLRDLESAVTYIRNSRPDLQITIYSGHVIKEQLGSGYSEILARETSLWLAQYSSSPSWPKQVWPAWSLWQYTDKASVPGISGNVDGNRFNGSFEQCLAWFGPAGEPAPAPGPEPEAQLVTVGIRAPEGVEVKVYVNDELVT